MLKQTLPHLSSFSSQAVFKSGIQVDLEARDFEGEQVMARADVACRLGGHGTAQVQVPHCVLSTGLTPLHTAVLALNAAMLPAGVCPRMQSSQARDRLTCVQMLLQMGASHTSQVSLTGSVGREGPANTQGSVCGGPPGCLGTLNADVASCHLTMNP